MSQQAQSLLADLAAALDAQEFDRAQRVLADLQEEYETGSGRSQRRQTKRSRALLESGKVTNASETVALDTLWLEHGTTRITRSLIIIMANAVVEGHDSLAEQGELAQALDTTRAAIDELLRTEGQLDERAAATSSITDSREVPPTANVTSRLEAHVLAVDERTSLTLTVENAGDRPVEGARLEATPTNGVSLTTQTFAIGTVLAGGSSTQTLTITGTETGGQAVEVRLTSENGGSDVSVVSIDVRESIDEQTGGGSGGDAGESPQNGGEENNTDGPTESPGVPDDNEMDDSASDDAEDSEDEDTTEAGNSGDDVTNTGDDPGSEESDDADDTGPGFGLGGALAGLGGVGYLLKQRLDDDEGKESQ